MSNQSKENCTGKRGKKWQWHLIALRDQQHSLSKGERTARVLRRCCSFSDRVDPWATPCGPHVVTMLQFCSEAKSISARVFVETGGTLPPRGPLGIPRAALLFTAYVYGVHALRTPTPPKNVMQPEEKRTRRMGFLGVTILRTTCLLYTSPSPRDRG